MKQARDLDGRGTRMLERRSGNRLDIDRWLQERLCIVTPLCRLPEPFQSWLRAEYLMDRRWHFRLPESVMRQNAIVHSNPASDLPSERDSG